MKTVSSFPPFLCLLLSPVTAPILACYCPTSHPCLLAASPLDREQSIWYIDCRGEGLTLEKNVQSLFSWLKWHFLEKIKKPWVDFAPNFQNLKSKLTYDHDYLSKNASKVKQGSPSEIFYVYCICYGPFLIFPNLINGLCFCYSKTCELQLLITQPIVYVLW